MNIVLIGSGNVATHMGAAFVSAGCRVVQVYSRTLAHARALAGRWGGEAIDDLSQLDVTAQVYVIAVKDDALAPVVAQLPPKLQGLLLHTAGSVPMEVFATRTGPYGVLYPVQTFSKAKEIDFSQVPLAIEAADVATLARVRELAGLLSGHVFDCSSTQRLALHVAAVFACNFTNHLYAIAQRLLAGHELDLDLIRPLIRETAEKAMLHNPETVQTGPAVRGDVTTMQKHLALLAGHPEWAALYTALSKEIGRK